MKKETKQSKNLIKWDLLIIAVYFAAYLIITLTLLFNQPFGDPPDEINRYKIPQYIGVVGVLPTGFEESIRIPGYGFSYGFQPILPYMIQGFFMHLMLKITVDLDTLLYATRMVDVAFGLVMAIFVLLLARKWFQDKRLQYVFAFMVMFLPQSIFVHSYVNTDSCCMMSIAIMLYGLTCCLENHFAYRSCITMSIGIILCALSYYNAYGFILSCILLFVAHYLSVQSGKLRLDLKPFLKKGFFISMIVLLGISWWFIRSYILYDGDFLGLRTRDALARLYAMPELRPGERVTYSSQGYSVLDMLAQSDFLIVTINSFICTFGPMALTTALWIYRYYKFLIAVTLLACLLPTSLKILQGGENSSAHTDNNADAFHLGKGILADRPALRIFFHANMFFCILMPCVLCVYYSYSIDYQPQGRYLLPSLIPLFYYCVRGLEKCLCVLSTVLNRHANKPAGRSLLNHLPTGICILIIFLIILAVFVTVFGHALPYYEANRLLK